LGENIKCPSRDGQELTTLALIVFVFFCLQFVLQLITTVITANQRPAKASIFNFLGSLFSLTVIFILTKTTAGNLIYLGIALGAHRYWSWRHRVHGLYTRVQNLCSLTTVCKV
jgi:hypothetical protein